MLVSDEFVYGKYKEKNAKYSIGYKIGQKKIRLLVVQYLQMKGHLKRFKITKYMALLIKDGKNKSVWGYISNIMKK